MPISQVIEMSNGFIGDLEAAYGLEEHERFRNCAGKVFFEKRQSSKFIKPFLRTYNENVPVREYSAFLAIVSVLWQRSDPEMRRRLEPSSLYRWFEEMPLEENEEGENEVLQKRYRFLEQVDFDDPSDCCAALIYLLVLIPKGHWNNNKKIPPKEAIRRIKAIFEDQVRNMFWCQESTSDRIVLAVLTGIIVTTPCAESVYSGGQHLRMENFFHFLLEADDSDVYDESFSREWSLMKIDYDSVPYAEELLGHSSWMSFLSRYSLGMTKKFIENDFLPWASTLEQSSSEDRGKFVYSLKKSSVMFQEQDLNAPGNADGIRAILDESYKSGQESLLLALDSLSDEKGQGRKDSHRKIIDWLEGVSCQRCSCKWNPKDVFGNEYKEKSPHILCPTIKLINSIGSRMVFSLLREDPKAESVAAEFVSFIAWITRNASKGLRYQHSYENCGLTAMFNILFSHAEFLDSTASKLGDVKAVKLIAAMEELHQKSNCLRLKASEWDTAIELTAAGDDDPVFEWIYHASIGTSR